MPEESDEIEENEIEEIEEVDMNQRELRVAQAAADHAVKLVHLGEDSVERLQGKVEKCRQDLADAKAALQDAKEELELLVQDADKRHNKLDGKDVQVNAETAEIKAQ